MRTKFTVSATALAAMLALGVSPAQAQETSPGDGFGQVRAAAALAQSAAQDLTDDDASPELAAIQDQATEAIQAAVDRLEGAGGSGVAAEVLTALLAGESPAEIGAAHGADMAQAAADRRVERAVERADAGQGRPENAGRSEEAGAPDDAGRAEGAGKPDDVGAPDDAGSPDEAGAADDAGRAEGAGAPEGVGRPDDAGRP